MKDEYAKLLEYYKVNEIEDKHIFDFIKNTSERISQY